MNFNARIRIPARCTRCIFKFSTTSHPNRTSQAPYTLFCTYTTPVWTSWTIFEHDYGIWVALWLRLKPLRLHFNFKRRNTIWWLIDGLGLYLPKATVIIVTYTVTTITLETATLKSLSMAESNNSVFPDLYEASVVELQAGLDAGNFTSVDLVKVSLYL